jgi:hypothetical protein
MGCGFTSYSKSIRPWPLIAAGPLSLALPALAPALGLTLDELLGQPVIKHAGKRGPAPRLMQHFERVSQLPRPKQRLVMEMLEAVLAQPSR